MKKRLAVLPGTFDPITYGHLDIIRRGAELFDELVIAVSRNPSKQPFLSAEERVELINGLITDLGGVSVELFEGMTVDFVKSKGSNVILRGIRTFADFEYEFQLAIANRRISGVETVFVMASAENSFVRSTLIKEAYALGGDISAFVPPQVVKALAQKTGLTMPKTVGLSGAETPPQGKKGSGLRGEGIE
ncbi:MAG: pantetheine-phosphate adenylyltransferase [Planctomycetes bacterium]|nr:pantetheine-phosphate adenylyltransferase [Planctomycetota bacterium]